MRLRSLATILLAGTMSSALATPQGWYIRLTVEAANGQLKDETNSLGQLSDSVLGYDHHDLVEPAPMGAPYLTLVFPHPDWGSQANTYTTDFHAPSATQPDNWQFEVRSDDPKRVVTLRWIGDEKKLNQQSRFNGGRRRYPSGY